MRESTSCMLKKHGWRIDRAIHHYIYFTFYAPYTRIALYATRILVQYFSWFKGLTPIARAVFNRYHSKILSSGDAQKILTLNENLSMISDKNKKVIPYKYATRIIFQEPEYIAVMDCPCKQARKNPCEPVNCCIAVGRGIASFWLDHCKKYHARKISQQEALHIIKEYRRNGHVTQAFFKVATGGSTGVICNCCPECCVSLEATKLTKKIDKNLTMNAASGYVVIHDSDACRLCGTCVEICPFNAIEIKGSSRLYNRNDCLGCELCVEHCTHGALSLHLDADSVFPLDIDLIKGKLTDD
jgi:NAD-dependent dihydropyrimidine dehydrogenase PreA subunit